MQSIAWIQDTVHCTMHNAAASGCWQEAGAPSLTHLSSANSSEFPDSIILCWASLWRRLSADVAPIRTMVSPTCRPHFAARLPGVTCNREDIIHSAASGIWCCCCCAFFGGAGCRLRASKATEAPPGRQWGTEQEGKAIFLDSTAQPNAHHTGTALQRRCRTTTDKIPNLTLGFYAASYTQLDL